ncbi:orotidine-5'-phosphate decarboxylase [Halobacillus sp. Marseille-Q1614]|uniref:orotidine-5'-phosphate decarboxylase n=1 Tax=Halobacillus sp. Marseille-Q1614 TaxID=2709134 RepID=UPI00156E427C|nr:orotidine-5'-phosphate decarboxylase [Halobacillus sp. Marseille-Q1614]
MNNPLYVALDFPGKQQALEFIEANDLNGVPVKVGMELFYREGPAIIEELKKRNHPVFVDLKLHDIPATVRRAMTSLASLEVDIVNLHAQGGSEMMQAAAEGLEVGSAHKKPLLLAVTQLTSTDDHMLENELLVKDKSMGEAVVHYAKLAKNNRVDGVVCSVKEVPAIRAACGPEFVTLTPGIRQDESNRHDQKRVATPRAAGEAGSDYIVVGRNITQSSNPLAAYQNMKEEFIDGVKQRRTPTP